LITEFPGPNLRLSSAPEGITVGSDRNIWYTQRGANEIVRVTTTGSFSEFFLPTFDGEPVGITAGPDGALWFAEIVGNKIGRLTTGGPALTPTPAPSQPIPVSTPFSLLFLAVALCMTALLVVNRRV
jgi:virginiamycin B lyase